MGDIGSGGYGATPVTWEGELLTVGSVMVTGAVRFLPEPIAADLVAHSPIVN